MSLIKRNEDKIFAKGDIGNVRKAQEDCHGVGLKTPNGDIFVVCDGMGGHVGGAMASKLAVDSIIGYISHESYATPIDALNGALQFANLQIIRYAEEKPEYKGMGTTACIVLVKEDGVWIAHVGDSRIYLYLGKEKMLFRITKDHSYVQTLVDKGLITDEEAEHHAQKNRIMKALGIKPELQPSFNFENRPIHPKNGDIFLICSDGLCGMIPDRTIKRILGENLTLHQKGEQLINCAKVGETVQPGGQDNCTLELIEIDNSPYKTSEFKSYNPVGADELVAEHNGGRRGGENLGGTSNVENLSGGGNAGSSRKKYIIAAALLLVVIVGVIYIVLAKPFTHEDGNSNGECDTCVEVPKSKADTNSGTKPVQESTPKEDRQGSRDRIIKDRAKRDARRDVQKCMSKNSTIEEGPANNTSQGTYVGVDGKSSKK